MTFQEKLQFLMKITQTSNKELAENISVDPSLISLLRNGRRKMPQNLSHVRKMAAYFARHCSADYQRQAIAEMLDIAALRSTIPVDRLEQILFDWLCGKEDPVYRLLNVLAETPVSDPVSSPSLCPEEEIPRVETSQIPEYQFFYGDSGRREALHQSLHFPIDDPASAEFLVISDESVNWLMSDYPLRKNYSRQFVQALEKGMRIRQIMPSMNLLSRCVDSVRQWLPLYATGQVDAYYYPRLRDGLYSRSMLILPGAYAIVSTSTGPDYKEHITLFSTNPRLVQELTKEFYSLLSLCRPALRVYTDPKAACNIFQKLLWRQGEMLQMVYPLSAPTTPPELLKDCIACISDDDLTDVFRLYLESSEAFEKKLQQNTFVDISYLPPVKEVLNGEVPLIIPYRISPEQPCYTPERYLLHLRNILRFMEEYENYHFLPLEKETAPSYNLITSESGTAMLIKTSQPVLFLEIDRPVIVQACQEYLYHLAGQMGYKGIFRSKIKSKLKTMIQELENLTV